MCLILQLLSYPFVFGGVEESLFVQLTTSTQQLLNDKQKEGTTKEEQELSRELLALLEQRAHLAATREQVIVNSTCSSASGSEFEFKMDFAASKAPINMTLENSRFTIRSLEPSRGSRDDKKRGCGKVAGKKGDRPWPIELIFRWFGCSKRNSSVCPEAVQEIGYMRLPTPTSSFENN